MSMEKIQVGKIVDSQITGITKYGIFVSLEDNYVGLIHISEVSKYFIKDLNTLYKIGDIIKVKVLEINEDKLQVKLSIKSIKPKKVCYNKIKENGDGFKPLENMLNVKIGEKLEELKKNSK